MLFHTSVNLEIPLHHVGQYFDSKVGIFYNYFRDYDPERGVAKQRIARSARRELYSHTGRYVQSDPIGLDGGLNTYEYVKANPLKLIAPYGLAFKGGDWWSYRQIV